MSDQRTGHRQMAMDQKKRAFLERVAQKANETDVVDADGLRQLVDHHDLVWGVWNDPQSECGVACGIIKGEGALQVGIHTGVPQNMAWTAVKCRNAEETEAMRQVFGDKSNPQ